MIFSLFLTTLAVFGAQSEADIQAAIRNAVDGNDWDLVASLTAELQQQSRLRRQLTNPQIATRDGNIEMRVAEGKQVVAQVGGATFNIGEIANVASAYTDAAVEKVETKFDGKIANTLDVVSQQTDAMKDTLTALTDVEMKKMSADLDALEARAASRTVVDKILQCNAEGTHFDKASDGCILPKLTTCGPLPLPKGSGRVSKSCTSLYPLTCDAECLDGYEGSQDKITSKCGADGKWSIISSHKDANPKCNDVDECKSDDACGDSSFDCINKLGSYECVCGDTIDVDGSCIKIEAKKVDFDGNGNDVTYIIPGAKNGQTITYKIEVKGSGGGASQANFNGGNGGFASGVFKIKSGTKLIIARGGPGKGHGAGMQKVTKYLSNGGGLSGIFLGSVEFKNTIIIAGSGGGAGDNRARQGGHGGNPGLEGPSAHNAITPTLGNGATQSKGGSAGVLRGGGRRGDSGGQLKGGDAAHYGAGGGAGYYGGGAGSHYGGLCGCSGGGGSSFIQEASMQSGIVEYVSDATYKTAGGSPGEVRSQKGQIRYGTKIILTPQY